MVKYILDTNVYIEASKGYYHPDIVPIYWDILFKKGEQNAIRSPKQVKDEIKIQFKPSQNGEKEVEDRFLYDWARNKENMCFIKSDLPDIEKHFKKVHDAYNLVKEKHIAVLSRRGRDPYRWPANEPVSDQDMFVIATVLFYQENFPQNKFVLVTKETFDRVPKPFKPCKIPHICEQMGVKYIDDFKMLRELGIIFNTISESK